MMKKTTSKQIVHIKKVLATLSENSEINQKRFFKTGKGQYAEHDRFAGISVPKLRKVAQEFKDLSLDELAELLSSPVNEERLLALIILVAQYKCTSKVEKERYYDFYLSHLPSVNNWNLVDSSAHLIIGAHLIDKEKDLLFNLASSSSLWERRVAIVATWYFIRNNMFETTLDIAQILLNDSEDLIQKAVGWMLREVGERDKLTLVKFLNKNIKNMPRTMLRYAIEKFNDAERQRYLAK